MVAYNALLAAAAAAGVSLEAMLDALDNNSAAEAARAGKRAAPDECQRPSSSGDAQPKEPKVEELSSLQLLQDAWPQLAVDITTVMQAAVQQPLQHNQSAIAVAWPHLLQLHAVPKLAAAVERLQQ
jgi:hypothetical protein